MTHKISLLFFGNFLHNDSRQRPPLTRVKELAVHCNIVGLAERSEQPGEVLNIF